MTGHGTHDHPYLQSLTYTIYESELNNTRATIVTFSTSPGYLLWSVSASGGPLSQGRLPMLTLCLGARGG